MKCLYYQKCINFLFSFLKSKSPDCLALYKTNSEDSVDYSNFSVTGYSPLIWNDSVTHVHGHAV